MERAKGDLQARSAHIGPQRGPSPGERVPGGSLDGPSASVVIPAHDDELAIGCCLEAVAVDATGRRCEVIVVASGCDDGTVQVARSFATRLPRLSVVETDDIGRNAALNLGDRLATGFPRIYLDAEVIVEDGALRALIAALDTDEPVVAAPTALFDLDRSSAPVRALYRAYADQPAAHGARIGLGVYGMSAAGRARFADFPAAVADDVFVQQRFSPHERVRSAGEFTVLAPRRVQDLWRAHRRVCEPAGRSAARRTDDGAVGTGGTLRALVGADDARPTWSALARAGAGLVGRSRSAAAIESAEEDVTSPGSDVEAAAVHGDRRSSHPVTRE